MVKNVCHKVYTYSQLIPGDVQCSSGHRYLKVASKSLLDLFFMQIFKSFRKKQWKKLQITEYFCVYGIKNNQLKVQSTNLKQTFWKLKSLTWFLTKVFFSLSPKVSSYSRQELFNVMKNNILVVSDNFFFIQKPSSFSHSTHIDDPSRRTPS